MSGNPETTVGNFDLSSRSDCRMLERHLVNRWPELDAEFKGQLVRALKAAAGLAVQSKDVRKITRVVEVASRLEAQNQADEHLDEKNKRLDEGKPTESVGVRVFKVEFDE